MPVCNIIDLTDETMNKHKMNPFNRIRKSYPLFFCFVLFRFICLFIYLFIDWVIQNVQYLSLCKKKKYIKLSEEEEEQVKIIKENLKCVASFIPLKIDDNLLLMHNTPLPS